jgi:hypothetical protein
VKPCLIDGCESEQRARGWCAPHWKRWRRHGDPLAGGPERRRLPATVFFAEGAPNACWLWQGTINRRTGYGVHGKSPAHRVIYELLVGPIPVGLELDHTCKVRACVNPVHLEPVTGRENNARSASPSALNAAKTHCKWGHEFTPENTRIERDGSRVCRTCKRERQRMRKAA